MASRRSSWVALTFALVLLATMPVIRGQDAPPSTPPQAPPGGGGGPMMGPMMFGNGPLGTRDSVADFLTALGQVNLTPDFNLSPEQKRKIQAAQAEFKEKQAQWTTDHADDIRKLREQAMAAFGRGGGGGPNAEQMQKLMKMRQDLLANMPDSEAAANGIRGVLTDAQRDQFEEWRNDPAHQPPNPFAAFRPGGGEVSAPKGQALPSDSVPRQPGFYRLKFATTVQLPTGPKRVSMAYALYLPVGYDASKEPCPALIFLHGSGEAGTDGNALFAHGPAAELQSHGLTSPFAKKFPFIVICPQCPPRGERWDQPLMLKATLALLDDLSTKVRIDPDRVYVTGLSMGGKGTWLLAMEAPDRFAAIAPIAADTLDATGAAKLKHVATWAIVGEQDFGGAPEANRKMVAAIQAAGGDAKATIVPNEGHFVWPRFYSDPAFYDWFLTHKRGAPAATQNAVK